MMATIPTALSDWYAAQKASSTPGVLTTPKVKPTVNVAGGEVLSAAPSADPTKAGTSTYNAATINNPNQWEVDPSQTVQGQLHGILNSGSPLMQQAAAQGTLNANKRGLTNSSISAGEAQNAMIAAATPIAQADAATNAKAGLYNTDIQNTTASTNAAAKNDATKTNAQAENYTTQFNASNAYNKQQDLFKANVEATLAQINNEHSANNQQGAVFGTLSNDFSKAILQINTDTNMNQQSKDYAIKQLYQVYKAQLSMLSNIGNVPDVSTLLKDTTSTATTTKSTIKNKLGPAPNTTKPNSGNPLWDEIVGRFQDQHKAAYGVSMNRSWDADENTKSVYRNLVAEYNRRNT